MYESIRSVCDLFFFSFFVTMQKIRQKNKSRKVRDIQYGPVSPPESKAYG